MSWRRFEVLVGGLSPSSVWHILLALDANTPKVITDPQAIERIVNFQ